MWEGNTGKRAYHFIVFDGKSKTEIYSTTDILKFGIQYWKLIGCWIQSDELCPTIMSNLLALFLGVLPHWQEQHSHGVSQKESNPVSSAEGTVANEGEEIVEPASKKHDPKKTSQIKESDSESEISSDEEKEISTEDLIRIVQEKEDLLKKKHNEIKVMQEKVLRSYAEAENVMDRARREAENTKKFAIQSFAKSLLDVADNLSRASSVVKESFSKIDTSKDSSGAAPLLKTLLEGVAMTEKQLSDVFNKHGVERFDPLNEQFDPHMHMAVFQVQDASKQAGSVAVVLKPGYMLHDRVIRPAEVGVVEAVESEAAGNSEPSA